MKGRIFCKPAPEIIAVSPLNNPAVPLLATIPLTTVKNGSFAFVDWACIWV